MLRRGPRLDSCKSRRRRAPLPILQPERGPRLLRRRVDQRRRRNLKVAGHQPLLNNALERLLGKGRPQIIQVAKETLEGNLRGVLSQLTPEEVNQDELHFAEKLLGEAEARGKAAKIVEDGKATAPVLTQMIETWKAAFGSNLAKVVSRLGSPAEKGQARPPRPPKPSRGGGAGPGPDSDPERS